MTKILWLFFNICFVTTCITYSFIIDHMKLSNIDQLHATFSNLHYKIGSSVIFISTFGKIVQRNLNFGKRHKVLPKLLSPLNLIPFRRVSSTRRSHVRSSFIRSVLADPPFKNILHFDWVRWTSSNFLHSIPWFSAYHVSESYSPLQSLEGHPQNLG